MPLVTIIEVYQTLLNFFIMTTVLNRDSIKVKRDIQKRVEDYVIKYCEALEENFKQ